MDDFEIIEYEDVQQLKPVAQHKHHHHHKRVAKDIAHRIEEFSNSVDYEFKHDLMLFLDKHLHGTFLVYDDIAQDMFNCMSYVNQTMVDEVCHIIKSRVECDVDSIESKRLIYKFLVESLSPMTSST